MINTQLEALITLLEQEEAIYGEMAILLAEERDALLAMAMDRLGQLTARKETLALRIKAMDESRKMLARRLGDAFGLSPDQVTLAGLCRQAPPELAMRLSQIGLKLKETVQHCQSVNEHNARAATRGRELVTGAIEYLIAQADPAGNVYQAPKAKGGYGAAGRRPGHAGFISRQA
jgi:flagellar biosynthesis/type III secretory pathway chaperone